jgi:hypothetical protein
MREGTFANPGPAGERQIPKAENIVVAAGMLNYGSGAVLSRSPR